MFYTYLDQFIISTGYYTKLFVWMSKGQIIHSSGMGINLQAAKMKYQWQIYPGKQKANANIPPDAGVDHLVQQRHTNGPNAW